MNAIHTDSAIARQGNAIVRPGGLVNGVRCKVARMNVPVKAHAVWMVLAVAIPGGRETIVLLGTWSTVFCLTTVTTVSTVFHSGADPTATLDSVPRIVLEMVSVLLVSVLVLLDGPVVFVNILRVKMNAITTVRVNKVCVSVMWVTTVEIVPNVT